MDPPIQKHTLPEWREHVREFHQFGVDPYNSFDAPEVWYAVSVTDRNARKRASGEWPR